MAIQIVVDLVENAEATLVLEGSASDTETLGQSTTYITTLRRINLDKLLGSLFSLRGCLLLSCLLFALLLIVRLLHMGELGLQPLVPSVEGHVQLLDLLEQDLRVYFVDVFGLFLLGVNHFE